MLYDALADTATRLRGCCMAKYWRANSEEERAQWLAMQQGVYNEFRAIDVSDRAAVQAKTAEFSARVQQMKLNVS